MRMVCLFVLANSAAANAFQETGKGCSRRMLQGSNGRLRTFSSWPMYSPYDGSIGAVVMFLVHYGHCWLTALPQNHTTSRMTSKHACTTSVERGDQQPRVCTSADAQGTVRKSVIHTSGSVTFALPWRHFQKHLAAINIFKVARGLESIPSLQLDEPAMTLHESSNYLISGRSSRDDIVVHPLARLEEPFTASIASDDANCLANCSSGDACGVINHASPSATM